MLVNDVQLAVLRVAFKPVDDDHPFGELAFRLYVAALLYHFLCYLWPKCDGYCKRVVCLIVKTKVLIGDAE